MFIDEVGSESNTWPPTNENERYLSLTGVAVSIEHLENWFRPDFDRLRVKHFGSPPPILHRRKLVHAFPPFEHLKNDQKARNSWGNDFLCFLRKHPFVLFTVTLDRVAWRNKYPRLDLDPYHIITFNMLERYFYFLRAVDASGDVFIESRDQGGRRDKKLSAEYRKFYTDGPYDISAADIQSRFCSQKLKIFSKSKDIAGLQLADLLAKPCMEASLVRAGHKDLSGLSEHKRSILRILQTHRWYRSDFRKITGYGMVFRP